MFWLYLYVVSFQFFESQMQQKELNKCMVLSNKLVEISLHAIN